MLGLEGLEEGAVSEGLPRETARAFAHQTALATALLLREHPGSPADLKDQVASPGGTTIAALATLEDAGVRGAFIRAVQRSAVEVRAGGETRPGPAWLNSNCRLGAAAGGQCTLCEGRAK